MSVFATNRKMLGIGCDEGVWYVVIKKILWSFYHPAPVSDLMFTVILGLRFCNSNDGLFSTSLKRLSCLPMASFQAVRPQRGLTVLYSYNVGHMIIEGSWGGCHYKLAYFYAPMWRSPRTPKPVMYPSVCTINQWIAYYSIITVLHSLIIYYCSCNYL